MQVATLTSALDEDERSPSRSGGFTSGTHRMEAWASSRASLDLGCNTVAAPHTLSLDMVL